MPRLKHDVKPKDANRVSLTGVPQGWKLKISNESNATGIPLNRMIPELCDEALNARKIAEKTAKAIRPGKAAKSF